MVFFWLPCRFLNLINKKVYYPEELKFVLMESKSGHFWVCKKQKKMILVAGHYFVQEGVTTFKLLFLFWPKVQAYLCQIPIISWVNTVKYLLWSSNLLLITTFMFQPLSYTNWQNLYSFYKSTYMHTWILCYINKNPWTHYICCSHGSLTTILSLWWLQMLQF